MSGPYLGIDTATAHLALALWWPQQARCLGTSERVERRLSSLLQPRLAAFLASHQVDPTSIAGVAVGAGPGSTTGVRVGHAFALGFARARGIPLVTGDTLAALAAAALPVAARGWVAVAGRRDRCWVEQGERGRDGGWRVLTARSELAVAELPAGTHRDHAPDACAHLHAAWPAVTGA